MNTFRLKSVDGGVTAAKGFRAAGVPAAIKYEGRLDVALLVADRPAAAAAVFTAAAAFLAPLFTERKKRLRYFSTVAPM